MLCCNVSTIVLRFVFKAHNKKWMAMMTTHLPTQGTDTWSLPSSPLFSLSLLPSRHPHHLLSSLHKRHTLTKAIKAERDHDEQPPTKQRPQATIQTSIHLHNTLTMHGHGNTWRTRTRMASKVPSGPRREASAGTVALSQ